MVQNYKAQLINDLVEQFKGKLHTEELNAVIAKQLQDVYHFLDELVYRIDIDNSVGVQLDNIGSIVDLTRKEAKELANKSGFEYENSDAMYRVYLKYKMFLNNAECTYESIMKALHILWNGEVQYVEKENVNATFFLKFRRFSGADNSSLLYIPIIKPAGVKVNYIGEIVEKPTMYFAGAILEKKTSTITGETVNYFVDENNDQIKDEMSRILYERRGTA